MVKASHTAHHKKALSHLEKAAKHHEMAKKHMMKAKEVGKHPAKKSPKK